MKMVSDGLYVMYVKDGEMYPVMLNKEEWNMLQAIGNAISSPIKVMEKSLGKTYELFNKQKPHPMSLVKTADITSICR